MKTPHKSSSIMKPILKRKLAQLVSHITVPYKASENYGNLRIEINPSLVIRIAQNSQKMRLNGEIDWVHYEPIVLARHINTGGVFTYYEKQKADALSPDNNWKRLEEELDIKTKSAVRFNKAEKIK